MSADTLLDVSVLLHAWQVQRLDRIVAEANRRYAEAGSTERITRSAVIRTALNVALGAMAREAADP